MKLRLLLTAIMSAVLLTGFSQITSVGLIGSATPGGWDTDTDMIQDGTDPDVWTLTITLTDGAVKFRADDAWDVNWGSLDFPSGVGEQGGSDIPVYAGEYNVTFNSASGEYFFDVISPIGLVGDATPGGWDTDTKMYKDTFEHGFFVVVDLVAGSAKFRKDGGWDVNWGAADFPTGIGTQGGADIPVPAAGEYRVTLDTMSGAYSFTEIVTFETIGIIGDATPGGWDEDTDLVQSVSDADVWSANMELTDGSAKFRANDDWAINWGSVDFPTGVGTQGGDDIPVTAGFYQVTLNTATGEYSFLPIVYYGTVGIIGDATPGGWDSDTDMEVDAEDPAQWSVRMEFTDGEAKFRADDDWPVNWGAGDFPEGVGILDGANIPVPAGEYFVDFNTTSGAYLFTEIIAYDTIGIIGTATPLAGWDEDVDMDKDPENELHFSLNSIVLSDGEAKFRANDDWTVNWGAEDFPAGAGTQDGPNIMVTGGTYSVSLFTDTGEYAFGDPVSTREEVLSPAAVEVFPNPVSEKLNVDLSNLQLKGAVTLTVYDINGRKVMRNIASPASSIQLDVSALQNGNYILQINTAGYIVGKRFSITK